MIRPGRWLVWIGIVGNGATILVWAWAHLIGLPFGPEPGQIEPTTLTDLMATLFELLLVVWLLSVARRGAMRRTFGLDRHAATTGRSLVLVLLIVAVTIGTTAALAQPQM